MTPHQRSELSERARQQIATMLEEK